MTDKLYTQADLDAAERKGYREAIEEQAGCAAFTQAEVDAKVAAAEEATVLACAKIADEMRLNTGKYIAEKIRALIKTPGQLARASLIRCKGCGGTLLWKKTDEGFEVYHDCLDGEHAKKVVEQAIARREDEIRRQAATKALEIANVGCTTLHDVGKCKSCDAWRFARRAELTAPPTAASEDKK